MIPVLAVGAVALASAYALVKYRGENVFVTPDAVQVGPTAGNQHDVSSWIKEHLEEEKNSDALLRLISCYFGDRIKLTETRHREHGRLVEVKTGGYFYEIIVAQGSILPSALSSTSSHVLRIPVHCDKNGKATISYQKGDRLYSYAVKDLTDKGLNSMYLDKYYE